MNDKQTVERPSKVTPYDTGKVKIGAMYQPPPRQMTRSEEFIQRVLLTQPHPTLAHRLRRWLGSI